MNKHEDKYCPRCKCIFECKLGNILQCQCSGISFTQQERKFLEADFTDCLCHTCLKELKNQFDKQAKELPL